MEITITLSTELAQALKKLAETGKTTVEEVSKIALLDYISEHIFGEEELENEENAALLQAIAVSDEEDARGFFISFEQRMSQYEKILLEDIHKETSKKQSA